MAVSAKTTVQGPKVLFGRLTRHSRRNPSPLTEASALRIGA
jgi:hypothetical protein